MFYSGRIDSFTGNYRFLSNFYPSVIADWEDGFSYPTVEHAFVAKKVNDLKLRYQISKIKTPGAAKRFGRMLTLREDWEEVKVSVMYRLLEKKFEDRTLAMKLLATGDKELIEGNTWGDKFWGVCNGEGKNMLGNLLMKIREKHQTIALEIQ